MPDLVIDADGHVLEPMDLWEVGLPEHLREQALIVNRDDPHWNTMNGVELPPPDKYVGREEFNKMGEVLEDTRYERPVAAGFSAESTVESMDIEGIDVSVLFPSRGLYYVAADERVPSEVVTAGAIVYNDWLAEYVSAAPGRLFGAAMIDPRDVDGAIKEATRAVDELGHVCVFLRPNQVLGRNWHHPDYNPLWAALQELDVPVGFHEGGATPLPQVATDRFDRHGYWHVCTHPQEQQIAMVDLVLGGVLERFPKLRWAFLEAGAGWLPYWIWRMDEHFENEHKYGEFPELTMEPSEYVRRQCFVSIDTDEEPGANTLDLLDGTNVIWGSDYPHPDGKFPVAIKTLGVLPGMTEEYLAKVLASNPVTLFGPRFAERVPKAKS